jgi:hypothetical protein
LPGRKIALGGKEKGEILVVSLFIINGMRITTHEIDFLVLE